MRNSQFEFIVEMYFRAKTPNAVREIIAKVQEKYPDLSRDEIKMEIDELRDLLLDA